MLSVLTSDETTRADAIGNLHATGLVPATAELLIDAEGDAAARTVLVGMLWEIRTSSTKSDAPIFPSEGLPVVTRGCGRRGR